MIEIKLAKTAGFCWGVKRAIDITMEAANGKAEPIYTYGPLIHNPQLIKLLESKNIHVKNDINGMSGGEIIIRTHGITPEKRNVLREKGITINDATCPLVAKVQGMVRKFSRKGYSIVIVGDDDHAEVVGLKGYAETPVHVISSGDEVDNLPMYQKVFVCAQTTCDIEKYKDAVERLQRRYANLEVGETICDATNDRQSEVIQLCREVDAMIVVGGKNSANTSRLASIAREHGIPTWHIEVESELDLEALNGFSRIGVTAGASTPKWVIDSVVQKLASIQRPILSKFPVFAAVLGFLVKGEIYLALGVSALTFVNMRAMNIGADRSFMVLSFCAILSTYLLNQLLRPEEVKRSKARKYYYHLKFHKAFMTIALLSAATGGMIAFSKSPVIFGLYAAILLFGGTYGMQIMSTRISWVSNLKNIPASKDLFVGLAWAIIAVIVPFQGIGSGKGIIAPLLFTFGMGYVRTVLMDMRDIYSDQIVGKEALPILMGKEKATSAMYGVLLVISALLFVMMGDQTGYMAGYLCGTVYMLGFIHYNQNNIWAHSAKFDMFLDAVYFLIALFIILLA
ncbi:MAG: 4-hydroxy-3-methylbut-2-enyl diphosphate reductase [Nitrospinae bacterium]|nr:4-hydroxy-3-methylbut-2-enyl diphosphate reductase [Nitrospinota bacterium]